MTNMLLGLNKYCVFAATDDCFRAPMHLNLNLEFFQVWWKFFLPSPHIKLH